MTIRSRFGPGQQRRHHRDNLLMRMKNDEWDSVVNTNLTSVYRMSRRACAR